MKIAQPFKAGCRFTTKDKVPTGTAENFFRPAGTPSVFTTQNPELKLWVVFDWKKPEKKNPMRS
jgi:hypothetical protein